MESLEIMMSCFKPKGPDLIPDAVKDPLSACSVHACKICGSESPVIGH